MKPLRKQPQTPDGHVPESRRRLEYAVAALIGSGGQMVNGSWAHVPSLYDQLYGAVPGSQGDGGHSAAAARSKPPLWIAASKTLSDIDATVRRWQPAVPAGFIGPLKAGWCRLATQQPPTATRLRFLVHRPFRPQDCAQIESWADQINSWAQDIDAMLISEPVRALWAATGGGFAACPACDRTMAKKRDDAGEMVQTPAMQLAKDGSTYCQACRTTWGPEQARWVCRMLGYPLPAGVLE